MTVMWLGPTDEDEEGVVTMATGGAVRLTSFLKRASQAST